MKTDELILSALVLQTRVPSHDAEHLLGVHQPTLGLRDCPAEFLRSFDPFVDDDLKIGQSLAVRFAICRAARELGSFGNESIVFIAPVDNDLVFSHRKYPVCTSV